MEHERSVHSLPPSGKDMRTCWVIDHPAHFQLFRQWFRDDDILVVTERQELDAMLVEELNQHILRVPRVQGTFLQKVSLGRRRQKAVRTFLQSLSLIHISEPTRPY